MALINLTPGQLEDLGGEVKNVGTSVETLLGELATIINSIGAGWDGLAKDAYASSYSSMKETLNQLPGIVDGLGQQVIIAAQAFAQAEKGVSGAIGG